jgi:putative PIN family toxin of toxin-antitoxin system
VTVVLDTNVVVAALVAEGLCREVVHRAVRLRVLASSRPLMDELDGTLKRKFRITPATAAFLRGFRQQVTLAEPQALPKAVCRDPDDDLVLATAVGANATIIVTGGDDVFVLGNYSGIEIVTPRRFLELAAGGLRHSENRVRTDCR